MGLIQFMSSTIGRGARMLAGVVFIAIGVTLGGAWWTLAVVGLVPLVAGAMNVCLLAPAFGQPLKGH